MSIDNDTLYDQIHELVSRQIRGEDHEAHARMLQQLVTENRKARRVYIEYMQELFHISSRLSMSGSTCDTDSLSEAAAVLDKINRPTATRARKLLHLPKLFPFAAIAATIAVAFFLWQSNSRNSPADQSDFNKLEVATLVQSNQAVWKDSEAAIPELTRLVTGQDLSLTQGSVELVFDSGVEALVLAPCQVTIQDAGRISSEHGRISAKVGKSGRGFVIETPVARVTDLGTEFGVAISDSGETEVAVFEGEVDLEYGAASGGIQTGTDSNRDRLVQGEALRIERTGPPSRIVSIDNSRMPSVRQLPPMYDRPPVISTVRDNVSDRDPKIRSFYRIAHSGLREDSQAFVDRKHQWNGIDADGFSEQLMGADYVMPFNDDKFAPDLQVEVAIACAADVYVFLSDSVDVPAWLSDKFEDTGIDIGLDEGRNRFRKDMKTATGPGESIDTTFSVWKREIHGPQKVVLGAVKRPEDTRGYNMYGIAAVAR